MTNKVTAWKFKPQQPNIDVGGTPCFKKKRRNSAPGSTIGPFLHHWKVDQQKIDKNNPNKICPSIPVLDHAEDVDIIENLPDDPENFPRTPDYSYDSLDIQTQSSRPYLYHPYKPKRRRSYPVTSTIAPEQSSDEHPVINPNMSFKSQPDVHSMNFYHAKKNNFNNNITFSYTSQPMFTRDIFLPPIAEEKIEQEQDFSSISTTTAASSSLYLPPLRSMINRPNFRTSDRNKFVYPTEDVNRRQVTPMSITNLLSEGKEPVPFKEMESKMAIQSLLM